ncbi:hypothetical protein V8F20_005056 [Naviculisporaceae sp. PSN 640]
MDSQSMQALMARAKAVAEARKNRPAESFWPNVKKWLLSHEGSQPLPTCPVCYQELDVKGIDPVPSLDGTLATASASAPASASASASAAPSSGPTPDHSSSSCDAGGLAGVFPCGHMMCHNCILTNMEQARSDLGGRCPVCRTSCVDKDDSCGHKIHYHLATAEAKTDDWISKIPLTIPEGGRIPRYCWACVMYEHIYPDSLISDDEEDEEDMGVFWDLVLLEDESDEPRGQTVAPNSHNPSNSPSSQPDPLPFGKLRTARPEDGRAACHHCCYIDDIFSELEIYARQTYELPEPEPEPVLEHLLDELWLASRQRPHTYQEMLGWFTRERLRQTDTAALLASPLSPAWHDEQLRNERMDYALGDLPREDFNDPEEDTDGEESDLISFDDSEEDTDWEDTDGEYTDGEYTDGEYTDGEYTDGEDTDLISFDDPEEDTDGLVTWRTFNYSDNDEAYLEVLARVYERLFG